MVYQTIISLLCSDNVAVNQKSLYLIGIIGSEQQYQIVINSSFRVTMASSAFKNVILILL